MNTANNTEVSAGLNLNTGDIVDCTVEQIMPYGAFVRIAENGRKGMIHISELSYNFVKDINEILKIQDKIKAKVIKIDERGRIDLSLKQTAEPPAPQPRTPRPQMQKGRENFSRRSAGGPKFVNSREQNFQNNEAIEINNKNEFRSRDFHEMREAYREADPEEADSFEKKMASFLKTSEAKITDLNSRNSARSGRNTRRRNNNRD